MTLEEVKQFLEENKDKEEVQVFLEGLKPKIDVQEIEKLAQGDESIKSWLDSLKDKHLSKGLETWKENNLQGLIDEKVRELNPEKTPQEIELEKIKQQLAKMEREKVYEELKNKALTVATEKGIPTTLIDHFIGEDEDSTLRNLEKFQETMNTFIQGQVEKRLKDNDYKPPAGGEGAPSKNPFSKDNFNLTEQGRIFKENPDLYKKLKAEANK